jgi:undecaprenyl-diphosphatase
MRPLVLRFDTSIISVIQSGPQWLYGPMIFITNAGQPIVMVVIALIFSLVALRQDNIRLLIASGVVPATIGLTTLLKMMLQRARPETEYVQNMLVHSFSFPSGHAAGAMIGCGFFAYLAWTSLPQPLAAIAAAMLVFMIFAIGISRIYLGAHYPSDVVGGWLFGAIGLAVIIFIIKPSLTT